MKCFVRYVLHVEVAINIYRYYDLIARSAVKSYDSCAKDFNP